MRILLDTRDLIGVVERGQPVSVQEFGTYVRDHNHQIVLCFSNVRELASPMYCANDILNTRASFQSLEQLPQTYLKEATIIPGEIRAAIGAFINGEEYRDPSPYVVRWDQTMVPDGAHPAIPVNWINVSLYEIVFLTYIGNAHVFAPPTEHVARLREQFENDRAALRAGKAPAKQHFMVSMRRQSARHQVQLPQGREDEFVRWVYSNPNRCPGFRLNHEVYRALMTNYDDIPEAGDFTDLALVSAIPYVDAATLDNRMREYCRRGSRKMMKFGAMHNYSDRLYANVGDIMGRL